MRTPSRLLLGISCFFGGLVLGVTSISIGAGVRGADRFPDVPRDAYFDEAVGEMAEIGVIRGRPDGKFDPNAFATRAEIAVMLQRLRREILGLPEATSSSASSTSSRSSRSASSHSTSTSSSSQSSISFIRNPAGSIRFTTQRYTVEENASPAKVTIVRTGGAEGAVAIAYTMVDGTAKAGEDYVKSEGKLTFADGETSRIMTIDISDDSLTEGNEEFTIVLSAPESGAELGVPGTATILVEDDETSGTTSGGDADKKIVRLSALGYSMPEDEPTVTITVERTGDTSGVASVAYATSDITAKSIDYTGASGTLQFAANEIEKSFTITLKDDGSIEGNEKVNIKLSAPTGAELEEGRSEAELTIIDDEVIAFGTGSLRVAEEEYFVDEDDGTLLITVERTAGARGQVTVDFTTSNALAKAPDDYVKTSGTLIFRAGETAKTIPITILSDNVDDPNETFRFTLSNATRGATLGLHETVVTIEQ